MLLLIHLTLALLVIPAAVLGLLALLVVATRAEAARKAEAAAISPTATMADAGASLPESERCLSLAAAFADLGEKAHRGGNEATALRLFASAENWRRRAKGAQGREEDEILDRLARTPCPDKFNPHA